VSLPRARFLGGQLALLLQLELSSDFLSETQPLGPHYLSRLAGWDTEWYGQAEAEGVEQERLGLVGVHHAAEAQVARPCLGGGQDDVRTLQAGQCAEEHAEAFVEAGTLGSVLEGPSQHADQGTDQDVGLDSIGNGAWLVRQAWAG
jgi:hypothetical protein